MQTEVYKVADYTITLWKRGLQWHGRVVVMMRTHYTAEPSLMKKDVIENISRTIGISFGYWQKQEGNGE